MNSGDDITPVTTRFGTILTIGTVVRIYIPFASLSKNTWLSRPFGGFYTAPSGIRLSRISYYRRWYSWCFTEYPLTRQEIGGGSVAACI